jgi:O-antigen/teichoic acid export membrane protein
MIFKRLNDIRFLIMKNRLFKFFISLLIIVKSIKVIIISQLELPLFKNAAHLISGVGISYILGFLFWVIAVRFYDPSSIGLTFALLSILGIFTMIAELGFSMGLIRFIPNAGKDENLLINTCFTVSSLISILLAIVFIIGLPIWGTAFIPLFDIPLFSFIFIIFSIFFTIFFILPHIFLAKRITKFIVYINSIAGVIKIGLFFIIIFISRSVFGLFFISGLSIFLGILIGIYVFLPKVTPSFHLVPIINFKWLREIRNYSTVNYASNIFLQLTPLILPLIIVNNLGPEMNAYFQMSWTFIAITQVIPAALFNSLFVESTYEEKINKVSLKKAIFMMFALLIPISILLLLIPGIILSIYGTIYAEQGTSLLRILTLSIIPWGIIYLYISVERVKKSGINIVYITFLSAVLSIGLSYLLMLNWGLIGLGIGYLIGQLVVAIIATIFLLKFMKTDQHLKRDFVI